MREIIERLERLDEGAGVIAKLKKALKKDFEFSKEDSNQHWAGFFYKRGKNQGKALDAASDAMVQAGFDEDTFGPGKASMGAEDKGGKVLVMMYVSKLGMGKPKKAGIQRHGTLGEAKINPAFIKQEVGISLQLLRSVKDHIDHSEMQSVGALGAALDRIAILTRGFRAPKFKKAAKLIDKAVEALIEEE